MSDRQRRGALALLALVLGVGCGDPARITGRVVDNFGQPVERATVRVVNSAFSATTTTSGDFSLEFVPGAFTVAIGGPVVESTHEVSVAQLVAYPMGDVATVRLPPGRGVWVAAADRYAEVPGTVVVTVNEPAGTFGVDHVVSTTAVTAVRNVVSVSSLPTAAGSELVAFVDASPERDWALVNLEGDTLTARCEATIYTRPERVACPAGVPRGAANHTAEATWTEVDGSRYLVRATLDPGRYCFVRGRDTAATAARPSMWMGPLPPGRLDEVRGDHAHCFAWNAPTTEPEGMADGTPLSSDRRYGIEPPTITEPTR